MNCPRAFAPTLLALALTWVGQSQAGEPTHIVTSLKPIELLVRAVATEQTRITTLVPANASPHTYQMRPSERKALANADLIFWVGPSMETFLERLLTGNEFRDRALALAPTDLSASTEEHHDEQDDHGGGHQDHDEHEKHAKAEAGHGEHHDEGSNEHPGQDAHDAHDHGEGDDPHIWLDPALALAMVERIHEKLSQLPGADQTALDRNLAEFRSGLARTEQRIQTQLGKMKEVSIFTYHDAFSRFAEHYGLNIAGVMTLSPERSPGARHLADVQDKLTRAGNPCLLTEPQFNRKWWQSITADIDLTMSTWDPLAADIPADAEGYLKFQQHLADAVTACSPEKS